MIARVIDDAQTEAIATPLETSLAILGASGAGKSTALARRIERAQRERGDASTFVATHPDGLIALARAVLERDGATFIVIDDVEAQALFANAAKTLFDLDWVEFEAGQLDPEVPGLRSPDRFLLSAFRLFRKLRDAAIEPAEFLQRSLSGAADFYAKPPNFAHPELIRATKDVYRDSLDVSPAELARQYRREIDLAKILARLYEGYVAVLDDAGALTARDAIVRAAVTLRTRPAIASDIRARFPLAFVDDAQDLTPAGIALLEAVYGDRLAGVTLAGDPGSATNTFRGARADRAFAAANVSITLPTQHRTPLAIELACRRMCGDGHRPQAADVTRALTLHRAKSQRDEARFVAGRVDAAIRAATAPEEIALVFRSVSDVHVYEEALLERGVPVVIGGDRNIFTEPRVLDALALLWNAWDPFRHDWMLRTLEGHALALSDSSVAALCSDPPDAQTALFPFDAENPPTVRTSRWDPKRDLRLGWNVVRGEQDASLPPPALERLQRFRSLRESWLAMLPDTGLAAFAQRVWSDALSPEGPVQSARAVSQRRLLEQLLARIERYECEHPQGGLGGFLEYAARRAESELEGCEDAAGEGCVRMLSIDAARGRSFALVVIPDARAGSFPRWYVPDSFLFSPKLGMVPKENVGDARAARTAKFTFYIETAKTRERYNAEERRAFVYAMRRATREVLVTAYGPATRGTTAPEFFEELKNARLPGTAVEE